MGAFDPRLLDGGEDVRKRALSIPARLVRRSLRERGLLELASRRVHILNRKSLAALGDFDPRFLYASRSDVERADLADNAALNAESYPTRTFPKFNPF